MNEKTFEKMIEALNRHLAAKSRTLKEMLGEEYPKIRARDGNEYYVEKEELKFIANYVDEWDWDKFKIPIILEMTDLGSERVVYVRDKFHINFIKKAFGYNRLVGDTLVIYMYELPLIRKKLRTSTQLMFRVTL
ncbi:MAG: DUF61 family protein [Archaeoglobales archaeon]|nr:DUF61 family protein [Archaeoglobales archaeon]